MPDTEAEKQTALNDCQQCKYSATCELLAEWMKPEPTCKMGVKT